jgi:hypothetical protein
MKIKHFLSIIVILLCLIHLSDEKKKKRKKKSKDPLNKRPSSVSAELFCDACQAVLKETMKELRGKKRESDVIDAMTNICNPEKYNIYHFPPPDMREGCEAFVSAWSEEIPKVLINRNDDESPVQKLCFEITKACENVDWNNIKSFDDTIMIDGQPVKMADLQQQHVDVGEPQQEKVNDL